MTQPFVCSLLERCTRHRPPGIETRAFIGVIAARAAVDRAGAHARDGPLPSLSPREKAPQNLSQNPSPSMGEGLGHIVSVP